MLLYTLASIATIGKYKASMEPILCVCLQGLTGDSLQVVSIVRAAHEHNVVIIPFGGGTTVSGAVLCPKEETRMIVSLDTSKMNRILWIDMENMMARIEVGCSFVLRCRCMA